MDANLIPRNWLTSPKSNPFSVVFRVRCLSCVVAAMLTFFASSDKLSFQSLILWRRLQSKMLKLWSSSHLNFQDRLNCLYRYHIGVRISLTQFFTSSPQNSPHPRKKETNANRCGPHAIHATWWGTAGKVRFIVELQQITQKSLAGFPQ